MKKEKDQNKAEQSRTEGNITDRGTEVSSQWSLSQTWVAWSTPPELNHWRHEYVRGVSIAPSSREFGINGHGKGAKHRERAR